MRRVARILWAVLGLMQAGAVAFAQPAACSRTEFETAVSEAAQALGQLTQKNTPPFQEQLRQLKDKRNWSHDQFMAEAAPFVQDDSITEFDNRAGEHLDRINSMSSAGSSARTPDCRLLAELRANMKALVETQTAKWAYMFKKLDAELAK